MTPYFHPQNLKKEVSLILQYAIQARLSLAPAGHFVINVLDIHPVPDTGQRSRGKRDSRRLHYRTA
jgi:hypothetical protein